MNKISNDKIDTIIVSAHECGIQYVLKEKNMWYLTRIDYKKIKLFKYIAFYETSPISSINFYSKIKKIIYNKEENHYDVFLIGKPIKIKSIILDEDKKYLSLQGMKYISLKRLLRSRKMSDL